MEDSLKFCEDGLDFNPKYAPLWFQYLKIYEKASPAIKQSRFDDLQTILNDLHYNVNPELEWKIYTEVAQTHERLGMLEKASGYITNALLSCPENIKWKIWLLISRLQLRNGEVK